jgi:hypothetical protein
MDEALQHRALASIEKVAQALDIDRPILFDGPPIADFGRTVNDKIDVLNGLAHDGGVGQVAAMDLDAEFVQSLCVAIGPCNGADVHPPFNARFGKMTADKAGSAGNEARLWHRSRLECRKSPPPICSQIGVRRLLIFIVIGGCVDKGDRAFSGEPSASAESAKRFD